MQAHVTTDVAEFAHASRTFLHRDPVRCTVQLTVVTHVERGLSHPFVGAWVDDAGSVIGTSVRTGPYELHLSPMSAAAVAPLVAANTDHLRDAPGLGGPVEVVDAALPHVTARTGRVVTNRLDEQLFRLDSVLAPPRPAGSPRLATASDLALAVDWFDAFVTETGVLPSDDTERDVRVRIDDERLFFWVTDEEPVSMAGHAPPIAGVTRVGPVYTPPQQRGHGFARALVADVSAGRLAAGDTACCLFADRANPVSTAIYGQVGYRPVGNYTQTVLSRG